MFSPIHYTTKLNLRLNSATATAQQVWTGIWITADVAFTIATFAIPPTTAVKALSLIWAVGGGALSSVPFVAEKVHDPLAEGGSSYKVWETLDYASQMTFADDRVEYAGAEYYFDWRFRTDSDDVFAIKVSATVEWRQWSGYEWVYADETELALIISITNYWQ
jgi:hypothetical protein